MAVKVEESYHTLLGISLQSGGQRGESPRMEPNIVSTSQQYRVVTPYHTFRAYPFRQPPESTEPRFQCRQVTFHIPAVWIQRELEIIPIISQPLQSVQHGSGILRPENDAVHRIGSKADPAYRTRIERIGYEYVPLLQPVIEPRRIKRRNIRSPARTYYHGAQ